MDPVLESSAPPRSIPAPAAGVSRRILVVEDDHDSAEALSLMLRLWGHEVAVAHDGVAALAAAARFSCDVVIVDIGLPLLDGHGVAAQLRLRPEGRRPTLIALTGFGRDEDRQRAMGAGFDIFLVKPVSPDLLRTLLAGPAARQGPKA